MEFSFDLPTIDKNEPSLHVYNETGPSETVQEEKFSLEPLQKIYSTNSECHQDCITYELKYDKDAQEYPDDPCDSDAVELEQESIYEPNRLKQTEPYFTIVCNNMLTQISKNLVSVPFRFPVDPIEDGVLDYYEIVKNPMDLQTIRLRLERGKYRSKDDFYRDLELIISNSRMYHKDNADFLILTKKFENLCTRVRRTFDPKQKRSGKQISHSQVNKAFKAGKKGKLTIKKFKSFSSGNTLGDHWEKD